MLETIWESGPLGRMIWAGILGASITMVTFVIQNILTLRNDRLAPAPLYNNSQAGSQRRQLSGGLGDLQRQQAITSPTRSKSGLERVGRGKDVFNDALAEHGLREAQTLRTRNSYLSVIGVISPMIGLLGTVIGMMRAFAVLGQNGLNDQRALASSIGEVLLATASGLFIAIPAFVSYYIFRNRAQIVIVNAEDRLNGLVEEIPFDELQGVRIGENFSAGDGMVPASDDRLAPGVDGAHDELPGVQRRDHRRPEPVPALRRDAGLGRVRARAVG